MCRVDNNNISLKNDALAGASRTAHDDYANDCGHVAVIILPSLWKVLRSRAAVLSGIIIIIINLNYISYF